MSLLAPGTPATDVRELSPARCRELLEAATVGRLGFVTAGGLQIVPLSYRASDGVLYLSTRPGSAADQLADAGRAVAFEVDYHAPDFGLAWSVLMQGRLETLDAAGARLVEGLRLPITPWAAGHLHQLRFVPSSYSGRAITHTAP